MMAETPSQRTERFHDRNQRIMVAHQTIDEFDHSHPVFGPPTDSPYEELAARRQAVIDIHQALSEDVYPEDTDRADQIRDYIESRSDSSELTAEQEIEMVRWAYELTKGRPKS